ncbi:MAG: hypothetical protein OXD36_07075, partial [Rhodobacter sp.]|nr:hypothetical protein [Rhodobacter sp.]
MDVITGVGEKAVPPGCHRRIRRRVNEVAWMREYDRSACRQGGAIDFVEGLIERRHASCIGAGHGDRRYLPSHDR